MGRFKLKIIKYKYGGKNMLKEKLMEDLKMIATAVGREI